MFSRSILLENSFRDTGIVNTAFPYLTINDSLASAFILFESEEINRVVVVDEANCLVGILDRASILSEFTPPKNLIPKETFLQDKYLTQRSCNSIKAISRENLSNCSHLIRRIHSFNEDEFLLYGIRYFLCNSHYLPDDLLIITDSKMRVTGTISGKEILSYLMKCVDLDSFSQDISSILGEISPTSSTSVCLASESLENGLYIVTHTPTVCIIIRRSNNNKLVGILTRERINQLIHPLYPQFLSYPLDRFMRGMGDVDVFNPEVTLVDLCQILVGTQDEFVIVKDAPRSNNSYSRNDDFEYKIISIKSTLDWIVSKIDSSI